MCHKIKNIAMILAIMVLFSLAPLIPSFAPIVRAQSPGEVCLAQPPALSCPSTAPVIPGSVGSQLRVAVFIQNSAPLGAFDITILAYHTILKPSDADLTGTIMLSPYIVSECIGGTQQYAGGASCPSTATPDTIELAVYNCVGCGLTSNPTTGLLFTAIYQVTAPSATSPIGFQTGCSASSVGSTSTCVLVTNGGLGPVPETAQTATFTALSSSVPVAVTNTVNFQGFTVTTNGTLTVNAGALSLTGLLTVTARNSSTGILLFSKTYVVPSLRLQNRTSAFQSVFLLNVAVSPYPLSSDIAVTLTGGSVSVAVQVTRQVDINLSGSVDIVDFSVVAFAYGSTLGSPKYNPQADLDANGAVNIIDLAIVGFFYGALDLK